MPSFYLPDLIRLAQPGALVRNPDIWLKDVDTSCICINLYTAPYPNCTLVSPLHVLGVAHNTIDFGSNRGTYNTPVRFITMDNEIIDRTALFFQEVGGYDLAVGLLDEEIPNSVKIAKIFPANWRLYFKKIVANGDLFVATSYEGLNRVSCLIGNQDKFISPIDWIGVGDVLGTDGGFFVPPIDNYKSQLNFAVRGGDSGSGMFILFGNELVFISCVASPFLSSRIKDINATMLELGGGYTLTEADPSIGGDIAIEDIITSPQISNQIIKMPRDLL